MRYSDKSTPQPHVIDQIKRRQEQDRQREEERRLPLELPLGPPPGWKRDPSGEWIRDNEDREDDGFGVTIQM
jgi:hypothetical protein